MHRQRRQYTQPPPFLQNYNAAFEAKTNNVMEKEEILIRLRKELKQAQHDQITEIYATLPDRIGRYTLIQLIKFTLNTFGKNVPLS